MALLLESDDKYSLWEHVMQGAADRVFVPTESPLAIGSIVPVRLSVPKQGLSTHILATVVGRRPRSARFPAGVFVHFMNEVVDSCRLFLGLAQSPDGQVRGRKAPRAAQFFSVRFVKPPRLGTFTVLDVSQTGLRVTCPADLKPGEEVEVSAELGKDGGPLRLKAEVIWVSTEKRMAGMRLQFLSAEAAERLARLLESSLPAARATSALSPEVVVADEDEGSLALLQAALAPRQGRISRVRTGEEALSLVRRIRPRLIVLDVLLPSLDAVDLCRQLRADAELADIPVLFFSAMEPERLHRLAKLAGATDYLSKPATSHQLTRLLDGCLS